MSAAQRLSREDWILAALRAMSHQGMSGIAVEPLAKSLGTTKGSFYWHFRDRADLVLAALERWEREGTEAVIEALGTIDDARTRLRRLCEALFLTQLPGSADHAALPVRAGGKALDLNIALTADPEMPAFAELVDRVTTRRVVYIAEQLCELGIESGEASRRALLAYTSYIGFARLARGSAETIPHGADAQGFVDSMLRILTQGAAAPGSR